jgi:xanthine dehydrogenase large subunit
MNHGGTEMGQGLHLKVAQVVASEFQIDFDRVKITATTTAKVPNTAPPAASSGADLNGMAAQDAARQIRQRLERLRGRQIQRAADQIEFLPNRVRVGNQEIAFTNWSRQAYSRTASSSRRRATTRRRRSIGTAPRAGPRFLLLCLRRGGARKSRSTR